MILTFLPCDDPPKELSSEIDRIILCDGASKFVYDTTVDSHQELIDIYDIVFRNRYDEAQIGELVKSHVMKKVKDSANYALSKL